VISQALPRRLEPLLVLLRARYQVLIRQHLVKRGLGRLVPLLVLPLLGWLVPPLQEPRVPLVRPGLSLPFYRSLYGV